VTLLIDEFGGSNWRLALAPLSSKINAAECTCSIRNGKVTVSLKKHDDSKWFDLVKKK
jgi:hypothetical protein